ncbi:DUF6090 family protein [Winogradskyella jejuensis]|uniref:Uncharacterized protein n=1 Tax=Winogradskyella jejuensis TaxID=1089305 RepID=A0A1M5SU60_9FLAO|nr:DUF6090 family protein [Winogradskyella jejuensis]SHH42042.1 hypothetical protein SAMN05444148_1972 [Winogradskyella jejuensis]
MSENKTSRYFKYAIGEIILVVIGILIALQINNWNQYKKDQKLEQQYYCRLLEDVNQDLVNFNDYVHLLNEKIATNNTLIQRLQDQSMPLDSIAPLVLKSIKYSIRDAKATTDAFEDIKSSGNLNIIKDLSLKNQLADYYKTLANTSAVIESSGLAITDKRFFESEDLLSSGWIKLIEDFNTIDTTKVNYESLKSNINFTKEIRKNMLNDAIFYLGINSRNRQLLMRLEKEIVAMIEILNSKCKNAID